MVVLGEGLPVGPVGVVEVLDEAEPGMLAGLELLVLADQVAPLVLVVPFEGVVFPVVTHLRLQTGLLRQPNSVSELPHTYNSLALFLSFPRPLPVIPAQAGTSPPQVLWRSAGKVGCARCWRSPAPSERPHAQERCHRPPADHRRRRLLHDGRASPKRRRG